MGTQRGAPRGWTASALFAAALFGIVLPAPAQNPQVQQRVAEIRQAVAANRQALAHYTWQEQQTIIINGEVKKQDLFQVRLGPDGKPQRTLLSGSPPPSGGGPIKQRVVEKKTQEYQQYAQQIAALAQRYAQPDPERLQQAYQRGNVTLGSAGNPGESQVLVTSYIKPNDSVAIVFSQTQKAILSLQISSYLDNPNDGVRIATQFDRLPDGTTHVSSTTVTGVSKKLTVRVQNGMQRKGSKQSVRQRGMTNGDAT